MDKVSTITSIAAPLPQADIDTDMILPAQFLLRLDKNLGPFAFHGARQKGDFVLDQPAYQGAQIIVGGPRFGIGSSREQAVWALLDAGIRCIIAPSFGEIFYGNALRNGLLVLTLDEAAHQRAMTAAENAAPIHVDLTSQMVTIGDEQASFDLDAERRDALLRGLDETDQIVQDHAADIAAFEARQAASSPWLQLSDQVLSQFDYDPHPAKEAS